MKKFIKQFFDRWFGKHQDSDSSGDNLVNEIKKLKKGESIFFFEDGSAVRFNKNKSTLDRWK